jgi:hypothetical protein
MLGGNRKGIAIMFIMTITPLYVLAWDIHKYVAEIKLVMEFKPLPLDIDI